MTKKEIRTRLQKKFNDKMNADYHDNTLDELKDLCATYGDGSRWCSWSKCLEEIIKGGNSGAITRAFMLYEKHLTIDAEANLMCDIVDELDNLNI